MDPSWAPPLAEATEGVVGHRPLAPWVLLCVHVGGRLVFSGQPQTVDDDAVGKVLFDQCDGVV